MNSTTTHESCICDRYIKIRLGEHDVLPKYILKTLNLKKIRREDLNLKMNKLLGNISCRCDRCNPDTRGRN